MKVKSKKLEIISRIYLGMGAIILFTISTVKWLFILGGFDAPQLNDPVLSFLTNKNTMFLSVLFL